MRDCKPNRKNVSEIFKIGFPSSITNFIMSFSSIMLNNFAFSYGNSAGTAVGISNKLLNIMTMSIGGFVMGYLPFVGYNYGAGNIKRVRTSFWFTGIASTVFGLVLAIPFTLFGPAFMQVFTNDSEIYPTRSRVFTHLCVLSACSRYAVHSNIYISSYRKSHLCYDFKPWAARDFLHSYTDNLEKSIGVLWVDMGAGNSRLFGCSVLCTVSLAYDTEDFKN